MGVKKEEILGTSMEEFALASSSDKELLKKMASGKLDHFTVNKRYLRKDGTVLWVKITLNAIKDSNGDEDYPDVIYVDDLYQDFIDQAIESLFIYLSVKFEEEIVAELIDEGYVQPGLVTD